MDIRIYEDMAKLRLTEVNEEQILIWTENMLSSFDALQSVDTEGVEPLVSVLDRQTVLREDVSAKFITRDELLSGAPEQYDGYFQVPKTLE